jgi:crossover junction endodeoxyribonuclease RusA
MTIDFAVHGVPQPQGSAKAFMPKGARFPIVTSDNPNLKDWRLLVAAAAQPAAQAHGIILLATPVGITLRFVLPCPQSARKRQGKPHMTRPDLDKLARACLDALTGVLFQDDGQVVSLACEKRYTREGEAPGVRVTVETLEAQASMLPRAPATSALPPIATLTPRQALPW